MAIVRSRLGVSVRRELTVFKGIKICFSEVPGTVQVIIFLRTAKHILSVAQHLA